MSKKAAPPAVIPRTQEVENVIPPELSEVEDTKIVAAFHALNPRQQKFLLHYLRDWNATDAYRKAYGLLPTDDWAEVNGSQLLRNTKVKVVLAAFQGYRDEDLVLVRKTYIDAAKEAVKPIYGKDSDGQPEKIEDIPDHMTRIKAAECLAKLHGLNAADKLEHSGEISTSTVIEVHLPAKRD